MAHACNPSYLGGWNLEDHGLRPAWANSTQDSISKNNQSKMDWMCGSSSRVPALQIWSPELNPSQNNQPPPSKKKSTLGCGTSERPWVQTHYHTHTHKQKTLRQSKQNKKYWSGEGQQMVASKDRKLESLPRLWLLGVGNWLCLGTETVWEALCWSVESSCLFSPPVLATQEAEFRRRTIWSLSKIVQEILSWKYPHKKGWRELVEQFEC
jgi:hypothetical protein